jgi:hypothetical protein
MKKEKEPKVLSFEQKRNILYQIATAEIQAAVLVKDKDGNTHIEYIDPDIQHRLRAIEMDNRMIADQQDNIPQITGYRILIGNEEFK